MKKNYTREMRFMEQIIEEAYQKTEAICRQETLHVEKKDCFDLVTTVDKKIEAFLIDHIRAAFPEDAILSEEFHSDVRIQDRTWTIDPIDGTCNFANEIPQFGIQMSFVAEGSIVCAAVRTCGGEMFTAQKNGGAFRNGERIVSRARELEASVVSFGDFPHSSAENADRTLKAIDAVKGVVMKVRMFGAACLDYSYLAAGRTDMVFMYSRNPWDLYPGILLCEEAGCKVCGMDGGPYSPMSPGVIATNNDQLLKLVLQ